MSARPTLCTVSTPIKYDIKRKLKYFLDKFHGDRSVPALKELERVTERCDIDLGITTLANLIFIRSENDESSEKYKDFLKKWALQTSYYEVSRLLHKHQYEQAVILAIDEFDKISKHEHIDKEKLATQLKLMNLLIEACERNDTYIVIDLMKRLTNLNLLTDQNLASVVLHAINHQNSEVLDHCLEFIKSNDFTDTTLGMLCESLLHNSKADQVLKIIPLIKLQRLRNILCLKYVASFEITESFTILNRLTEDASLKITIKELPAEFLSISGLRDYEIISELCENNLPQMQKEMQMILLFSLLSSINNKDIPLDSSIFVLNCFDKYRDAITSYHKDIIFQQLTKYPLKITSIKLYRYFKKLGITITIEDYNKLLKIHMSGTEIDSAVYILLEFLNAYGELPEATIAYLKGMRELVHDSRIDAIIDHRGSIDQLKDILNYDYISNNLENERDRSRIVFKQPDTFKEYSYPKDMSMAQFFSTA